MKYFEDDELEIENYLMWNDLIKFVFNEDGTPYRPNGFKNYIEYKEWSEENKDLKFEVTCS